MNRKQLLSRIEQIKSKNIYLQIFEIIHKDKVDYTINDNGVFFNLFNLNDETVIKIEDTINNLDNDRIINKITINYDWIKNK